MRSQIRLNLPPSIAISLDTLAQLRGYGHMHASLAGWSMVSRILSQLFRRKHVRLEIECEVPANRKMKVPFTIKKIDKLDAALTPF